eukprot:2838651-Prymnesium_polylepis.1
MAGSQQAPSSSAIFVAHTLVKISYLRFLVSTRDLTASRDVFRVPATWQYSQQPEAPPPRCARSWKCQQCEWEDAQTTVSWIGGADMEYTIESVGHAMGPQRDPVPGARRAIPPPVSYSSYLILFGYRLYSRVQLTQVQDTSITGVGPLRTGNGTPAARAQRARAATGVRWACVCVCYGPTGRGTRTGH